MRAAQGNLRPLGATRDTRHVGTQAGAVFVRLARHLLLWRQHTFDGAIQQHTHERRVRRLLHHAGNDVAFFALELAKHLVVADVAQALNDDLLRRKRRDAAEIFWLVFNFAEHHAVVVNLRNEDARVAGLRIHNDARRRISAALGVELIGVLEVGRQNGLLDNRNELLERDLAVDRDGFEALDRNVHVVLLCSIRAARFDRTPQKDDAQG